jgi:hypothetical protein
MGPITEHVRTVGSWPVVPTPVVIVVGIPVVGPSIPIVIVRTADDMNSGPDFLEIIDLNGFHLERIPARSHDMEFHLSVFHMPGGRDIHGFRGPIGSEDEGITVKRSFPLGFGRSPRFFIRGLDPKPSSYVILL